MRKSLLCCLLFCACMTTEKARERFIRQPEAFADLVPMVFPWVPDSVGKIPVYKPGHNRDYTPALDSASAQGDSLLKRMEAAEKHAGDSINVECAALVGRLKQQMQRFANTIDSLRKVYRAPLPDSVPVPYPVRSLAELHQIAQLKSTLSDRDAKITRLERSVFLLGLALAVMMGAIALRMYLKTKTPPSK